VTLDGDLHRDHSSGHYLCGRRLYETMLVWETDRSLRGNELGAASILCHSRQAPRHA
jgi:hypothetical protein